MSLYPCLFAHSWKIETVDQIYPWGKLGNLKGKREKGLTIGVAAFQGTKMVTARWMLFERAIRDSWEAFFLKATKSPLLQVKVNKWYSRFEKHFPVNNCTAGALRERAHCRRAERSCHIDLAPRSIIDALPSPRFPKKKTGILCHLLRSKRRERQGEGFSFIHILV